jgi:hypothetical protein
MAQVGAKLGIASERGRATGPLLPHMYQPEQSRAQRPPRKDLLWDTGVGGAAAPQGLVLKLWSLQQPLAPSHSDACCWGGGHTVPRVGLLVLLTCQVVLLEALAPLNRYVSGPRAPPGGKIGPHR